MTEKPSMGEMRPKLKEVTLPIDTVKELADLIPKPENHHHYKITGIWKPNQEVFQVNEGDGILSDYSFPEKADMSVVQFASRKTYTKELNMWGKLQDYPVSFDRKTGSWKKLNIFQRIKHTFSKETHIPAQVVTESVHGKDLSVLHTLEQKRPIGKSVQEAELNTLQDAKVDLGMKYKHMDHALHTLRITNQQLENTVKVQQARISSLTAQLFAGSMNNFESRMNQSMSNEPPTYGNIMPSETSVKKSKPPERTPPKKDEKLDKRGDEVLRQFEKNVEDAEYKKWIANHPDKAYYENSGEPYPTKEEYKEIKAKEAQAKKDGRDANERGLAKDQ